MIFDDVAEIKSIATKTGTSIFVLPRDTGCEIEGAFYLKPEEKTVIAIEQVRDVIKRIGVNTG